MTVAKDILDRGLLPQPLTHCHHHEHHCCEHDCKCDNYSKVDLCELNTVLKDLDNKIRDVKEYETLSYVDGKTYPKNSVVIFKNKLYSAKVETSSPPDTEFWKEVDVTNEPKSYYNELPIGTVVTVPKDAEIFGFIDYVPGKEFSTTLFPALHKALGVKAFPTYPDSTLEDSLPIGSILHVFSKENIPNGWVLFEHKPNNLANTELHDLLTKMTVNLPNGVAKNVWDNALKQNTFPAFTKDFFLRVTRSNSVKNIGEMYEHSTINLYDNEFVFPPVVNQPNDVRQELSHPIVQPLTDPLTTKPTLTPSDIVLYGSSTDAYSTLTGKREQDLPHGTVLTVQSQRNLIDSEVAPYHMSVYMIVKASSLPRALGGFKQVIKAFDVIDAPREAIVLEIQELLNTRLEFIQQYETLTKKFEAQLKDLQTQIDDKLKELNNLYGDVYQNYISKANESLNQFKEELYRKLNEAKINYDQQILELNNVINRRLEEVTRPYVSQVENANNKVKALEPKVSDNTAKIGTLQNKLDELTSDLEKVSAKANSTPDNVVVFESKPDEFKYYERDFLPTVIYGKRYSEAVLACPDTWYTIVKGGKRYNLPLYLSAQEINKQ